jgi:hypothetical protein
MKRLGARFCLFGVLLAISAGCAVRNGPIPPAILAGTGLATPNASPPPGQTTFACTLSDLLRKL